MRSTVIDRPDRQIHDSTRFGVPELWLTIVDIKGHGDDMIFT